jgi:beta-lactamase regulating signal transducer with metallopeptidase domain
MGDLGLAVVFCVLQVTLLAAFVALCYLCSRRTRPGFRSSIASTGVFLVLALSLLCVSPYPIWVEIAEPKAADSVQSRDAIQSKLSIVAPLTPKDPHRAAILSEKLQDRPSEVARQEEKPQGGDSTAGLSGVSRSVSPGETASDALGIASRDGQAQAPAQTPRLTLFANELQRALNWIVDFRDWLVPKFRSVVRWGWLVGILLLAGIGWNLLRLLVGWWQLRWFHQRSTPIQSPELAECLDVVQAALSLRTPVELRQTSEMTSPATIGWWRPVVILPVDWQEWTEEERLGVLAHELAHVRRHDFLTGLFSQVVLAIHFYHPLINWLVNRLHLEQELAADAAAVRVVGGQKPYLKMLAGMALKDHTSSIPVAARTFFPRSETLMARVELLRGHKVEPGDGSFSWRTAVRGVLVCLGLAVAGLRPLAGSDGSNADPIALTSASVPETASGCVVWRPERIPKSHPLSSLLFDPAKGWARELPQGLGQIALFWLETQGANGIDVSSPAPDGVVLNFTSTKIRDEVYAHLERHPEQNLSMFLVGGQALRPGVQAKSGEREILICRDKTVLLVAMLSASTKPTDIWKSAWARAGQADLVVGFRPSLAARFHDAVARHTPLLDDLMKQLSDGDADHEFGLASVRLNRNRCDLELIPRRGATPDNLLASLKKLGRNWGHRVKLPAAPGDAGQEQEFDPVRGNSWCQLLLESSFEEELPGRVRIDMPLSALMGIGLRLDSDSVPTLSFDQIWSQNQTARLELASGLLRSALLAYRARHNGFPTATLRKDANSPPYSWRVALLPFLGRQDLYDQYHFDLPWNSPENLELLSQIPDIYRSFGSFSSSTPFFHGSGLNPSAANRLLAELTEGETIVVLGSTEVCIPWTSPIDGALGEVPEGIVTGASVGLLFNPQTSGLAQHVWPKEVGAPSLGVMAP